MRYLGITYVLVVGCACGAIHSGCNRANKDNLRKSKVSSVTSTKFSPHPGGIVFKSAWGHSEKTVSASDVPDTNKFIYYDSNGTETTDVAHAAKRAPILEVDMVSVDKNGKLIDPKHATTITVTEYGLNHQELRHTTGYPPE